MIAKPFHVASQGTTSGQSFKPDIATRYPGGGGGGGLRYLGGYATLVIKIKDYPNKALFPVKNSPSFIKTLKLEERIITFDVIIICLICGSSKRQQILNPSQFESHSASEPRILRGL